VRSLNHIQLPPQPAFNTTVGHVSAALHEVTH
jgi:antirestriction protein ArdC